MSYLALYRKYRPQKLSEVYGQDAIIKTLGNQIASNKIAHAYLFCGPRGTGKTSIAKIFAKAINCTSDTDKPCLQCDTCKIIQQGTNIDIIEIDAASNNGVDNIRDVIEECQYLPQYGKYKVYIIDEVHMLSGSAFNALLKTLEEPPSHVVFILATTERHKVPATIVSRCQNFLFKYIEEDTIMQILKDICDKEQVTYELPALQRIAKLAEGGVRDSLSCLDQVISFNNKVVTEEVVRDIFGEPIDDAIQEIISYIRDKNVAEALKKIYEMHSDGNDIIYICQSMYRILKEELLIGLKNDTDLPFNRRAMQILATLDSQLTRTKNMVYFDIAVVKMCTDEPDTDINSLIERIDKLEQQVNDMKNITLKSDNNISNETQKQNTMYTSEFIDSINTFQIQYKGLDFTRTIVS